MKVNLICILAIVVATGSTQQVIPPEMQMPCDETARDDCDNVFTYKDCPGFKDILAVNVCWTMLLDSKNELDAGQSIYNFCNPSTEDMPEDVDSIDNWCIATCKCHALGKYFTNKGQGYIHE